MNLIFMTKKIRNSAARVGAIALFPHSLSTAYDIKGSSGIHVQTRIVRKGTHRKILPVRGHGCEKSDKYTKNIFFCP